MTQSILHCGGRTESIVVVSGGPVETASHYDATYSDAAIQIGGADVCRIDLYDDAMALTTVPDGHTCWLHWCHNTDVAGGPRDMWTFNDSSGYPWVKIRGDGSTNFQAYKNTGTGASPVWTAMGTAISHYGGSGAFYEWDVSVTINSAGNHSIAIYKDRVLQSAFGATWAQASFTNIKNITMQAVDANRNTWVSQTMVTDNRPTVGAKVKTSRPTGVGNYTAWSGVYTDVNEAVANDTTVNQSTAAGDKKTYAMGDVTVPAGYVIPTVFLWARAKNSGGTPNNIKFMLRQASTDYIDASNAANLGVGYGGIGNRYNVDPNSAVAWTQTTWNSVEAGYQSDT